MKGLQLLSVKTLSFIILLLSFTNRERLFWKDL
jgi:hypothetical protein